MRLALPVASLATLVFASSLLACSSHVEDDEVDEGALVAECDAPAFPQNLDAMKKLSSCQLNALFESDRAKELTARAGMPDGPYEGIPLCRTDVLRKVSSKDLPEGVRAVGGSGFIYNLLKASEKLDNSIASQIWHGKLFERQPGALEGDVLNYIDVTAGGIEDDTRKSAEARYFIHPTRNFLVLDYAAAETGMRVLKGLSVELIRQVYDTARLIDEERGIYVGMAWFVDKPGEYTPEIAGTTAPSCFFALQKKATAASPAPADQKGKGGGEPAFEFGYPED